jgi:hypothetical protein
VIKRLWTIVAILVVAVLGVAGFAGGIYAMMGGSDGSGSVWGSKIGIAMNSAGRLRVDVLVCPGETVRDVQLRESNSIWSTAGALLWEIQSRGASTASSFVIGNDIPGFDVTRSLASAPNSDQPLLVRVDTRGNGGNFENDFRIRDVTPNALYVDGPGFFGRHAHVTPTRFDSEREHLCRLQPNGPGG